MNYSIIHYRYYVFQEFPGFKVSSFQAFKVSNHQRFEVLKFRNSKFHLLKKQSFEFQSLTITKSKLETVTYSKTTFSKSQKLEAPTFQNLKLSRMLASRIQKLQKCWYTQFQILQVLDPRNCKNNILENDLGCFLYLFKYFCNQ